MIKASGVLGAFVTLLLAHFLLATEVQPDNTVTSSSTSSGILETKRILLPNETNPQCPSDYFLDTESLQCTKTCSQDMFISAKTCVKACEKHFLQQSLLSILTCILSSYRSTRFLYHRGSKLCNKLSFITSVHRHCSRLQNMSFQLSFLETIQERSTLCSTMQSISM